MTFDEEVKTIIRKYFLLSSIYERENAFKELKSLILSKIPKEVFRQMSNDGSQQSFIAGNYYDGYNSCIKDMKDNLGV